MFRIIAVVKTAYFNRLPNVPFSLRFWQAVCFLLNLQYNVFKHLTQ